MNDRISVGSILLIIVLFIALPLFAVAYDGWQPHNESPIEGLCCLLPVIGIVSIIIIFLWKLDRPLQ